MNCSSCKKEFQTDKTGFIVCPNCGTVNLSAAETEGHLYMHASDVLVSPRHKRRLRRWFPNKLTSATAITAGIIILTGGLATAYHIYGQDHQKPSVPVTKPKSQSQVPESTKPINTPPPPTATLPPKSVADSSPKTTIALSSTIPQPTLDQIVGSINQQLSPYGVTATLSPPNNPYTYSSWAILTTADVGNLQQFSSYLIQEFSKYPKDLVINSGLKTIGLVKNLQVSGGTRAAAPAPSITGMLYDVNVMTNAGSAYAREVVSHEYWHYIDYKTHGSYTYDDPTWDACNPGGFVYGSGGASAYGGDSGYVSAFHPRADFITAYSEYAIAEDRAEMFGWLIYSPSSVKSLNDSGINCKINELTALVHQLSPSMAF